MPRGSSEQMPSASPARPVAIDTDPGLDDALALVLALRSPELRVELITTVAGNVPLGTASANARRVLGLLDPAPRPLLARGAARPLRRALQTAPWVHGADGLGGITRLCKRDGAPRYPPAPDVQVRGDAPRRLLELVEAHGPALTVVALGPLTNLARALRRAPDLMRRVGRVIVMGGAVRVPGNITPAAEFNFYVDPHAADALMRSGLPITLVPLDVTHQVRLTRSVLEEALRGARSPLAGAVRGMARALLARAPGGSGAPLHDPLAVAVALDPSLVTLSSLGLRVETRGEHTLGMSVAGGHGRARQDPEPQTVSVATAVDAERALALFAERVLAPERPRHRARSKGTDVLVLGSANLDLTAEVRRLPRPGETVMGSALRTGFGGKGANQALAARRAGASVAFLGKLGADPRGDAYVEHLRAEGVDVSALLRAPETPTGVALIALDARGQNQIVVAPGANAALVPGDVAAARPVLAAARVLVVQLETPLPAVEAALRAARRHGLRTVLNPAPARPLPRRLIRLVDVLVPNEAEAAVLTGRPVAGVRAARAALRRLGALGYGAVVITLGRRGVVWGDGQAVHRVPALRVRARDTTAAGDTFVGYLACGLAEARPLEEAVRLANVAAGLSVTRPGAQSAIPRRRQVARLSRTTQGRRPRSRNARRGITG